MKQQKEFFTRRLSLASYLMSKGMRLIRIDGIGNRRMFVFADQEQRPFLEKKYFNNSAIVNLNRYEQCKKTLLNYKDNIDLNKNEGKENERKAPFNGKGYRRNRVGE